MKIGISGASGQLGAATVKELKARQADHHIVAITRTPEKNVAADEARFGDYDQPETLASAYAGIDRLLIIPTSDVRPGRRGQQNVAAITAAVIAGVKHVIFVSAAGTHDVPQQEILASYYAAEQRLMRAAPRWTIVRMNYYAEALALEAQASLAWGAIAGLAENRVAFVSREDIAAAAAGLLVSQGHEGAIYDLTGPESLSGAERAAIIAEVSGRPLVFAIVPEKDLRANLARAGFSSDIVDAVVSIQQGFVAGEFDVLTGHIERLSGKKPRTLRETLFAYFQHKP